MIQVLHLIKEYKGNYPLLNEYVHALPKERYQSIVCYLNGQPDGKNEIDSIATEVRYLGFSRTQTKRLRPAVVIALAKLMRSRGVDIVHCHRHKATVVGTLAAAFAGGPRVISHVHGLARTRSLQRRFTNWMVFKGVRRIIAVSDTVKQDILGSNWGVDPSKVVTVRNGINLRHVDRRALSKGAARLRLGLTENDFVFGTVGRLATTKGQVYLLTAFSEIRERLRSARLVLIGDGPLRSSLERKADDLGISPYVSFLGYRPDVLELLGGIDVFVLPSLAEGLPLALLEAMGVRRPVIASRVGGIPEILGDSDYGILVAPRDPGQLSAAMSVLGLCDEERRRERGAAARKRVEDMFTVERMGNTVVSVYESIA